MSRIELAKYQFPFSLVHMAQLGNIAKIFLKILQKILSFQIRIPVFGLGCGVLGLAFAKQTVKMGKIAAHLLKSLEYRGYDSTGAIIQDDKGKIVFRKDVGSPSELVKTLGIEKLSGKIFCGQVRWATFGSVNKENSQPHEVKCKKHIYGAHNGNITNTCALKQFLIDEGHDVISNNDGEILVHTVEQYFDMYIEKFPDKRHLESQIRKDSMRKAIIEASKKLAGSYAAVIVDPVTEIVYAIKAGSSLYIGVGEYEGNRFILASSDLTAILHYTKVLIKIYENEFIEFSHDRYQIYALKDIKIHQKDGTYKPYKEGEKINVKPKRSKLRAEDIKLSPPFKYFMEKEIYAEVESSRKLIQFIKNGSEDSKKICNILKNSKVLKSYQTICKSITETSDFEKQAKIFQNSLSDKSFIEIKKECKKKIPELFDKFTDPDFTKMDFYSDNSTVFLDIIGNEIEEDYLLLGKIMDAIDEQGETLNFQKKIDRFLEMITNAWDKHCNIYAASCGTSYHAAKTAALFFNEIAGVEIIPIIPGDFRGQYSKSLRDKDIIIGISQSGETKDLIDIFSDVEKLGKDIYRIAIVNNVNSTLGQEKSQLCLPIRCGPEMAVPATKSYINQITLLYYLAIRTAEVRLKHMKANSYDKKEIEKLEQQITQRFETLDYIPNIIRETINTTQAQIENVAEQIFLEPSIHILATKLSPVAQEGALKIRETVLNHTEGKEGAEFKHGPNTILGENTVFGIWNIESLMKKYNKAIEFIYSETKSDDVITEEDIPKVITALGDYVFDRVRPFNLLPHSFKLFERTVKKFDFFDSLYRNYPLIYITGPEERDVRLTISQINTHKIRGANSFLIAEENDDLLQNISSIPSAHPDYKWGYIELPKTGDTLLTVFSSIVVLQLLALRMSIKKMKYLNKLHVPRHGVHPDVPKNVSKSITVD
ncbi:MAG: SIS domain-containing protein [Candidatus Cloacimonetes bacterium]|nr:SIS domain-containing protein [Candidatus Cloacimonadota bacterium]